MREQFLNDERFSTLKDAQILTERWRTHDPRSVRTAASGACRLLPKRSSLRADHSHGRRYKHSWLVIQPCALQSFSEQDIRDLCAIPYVSIELAGSRCSSATGLYR